MIDGSCRKKRPLFHFLEGHISETARPTSRKIFTEFFLGIICKCAKFNLNRRGDSQTIVWSDTEWPNSCFMHHLLSSAHPLQILQNVVELRTLIRTLVPTLHHQLHHQLHHCRLRITGNVVRDLRPVNRCLGRLHSLDDIYNITYFELDNLFTYVWMHTCMQPRLTHTDARTHARTHARPQARTHTRARARETTSKEDSQKMTM